MAGSREASPWQERKDLDQLSSQARLLTYSRLNSQVHLQIACSMVTINHTGHIKYWIYIKYKI
jgi:hypothetical protein